VHSCPIPVVVHPVRKKQLNANLSQCCLIVRITGHMRLRVKIEVFVKLFMTMCSDAQVRFVIPAWHIFCYFTFTRVAQDID